MGAVIQGPPCPVCNSTETTLSTGSDGAYYTQVVHCRDCWEKSKCKVCNLVVCTKCNVGHLLSKILKSECSRTVTKEDIVNARVNTA